jgi:hypothetical protein
MPDFLLTPGKDRELEFLLFHYEDWFLVNVS